MVAKFGPTLAMYWQNLFAFSSKSVMVTSWSFIDVILIGLRFVRFITQFTISHVDLTSFLFLASIASWYCFLQFLKVVSTYFVCFIYVQFVTCAATQALLI